MSSSATPCAMVCTTARRSSTPGLSPRSSTRKSARSERSTRLRRCRFASKSSPRGRGLGFGRPRPGLKNGATASSKAVRMLPSSACAVRWTSSRVQLAPVAPTRRPCPRAGIGARGRSLSATSQTTASFVVLSTAIPSAIESSASIWLAAHANRLTDSKAAALAEKTPSGRSGGRLKSA